MTTAVSPFNICYHTWLQKRFYAEDFKIYFLSSIRICNTVFDIQY